MNPHTIQEWISLIHFYIGAAERAYETVASNKADMGAAYCWIEDPPDEEETHNEVAYYKQELGSLLDLAFTIQYLSSQVSTANWNIH